MVSGLTVAQGLLGAFGIAVVLAGLHLAAPLIRKLPLVPERATGSFAGGLAVAYVFLHLLPEIADGNEAIGEALSDVIRLTPLLDLGIFLVALVGFTAFYGLERLADASAARTAPGAGSLTAGTTVSTGGDIGDIGGRSTGRASGPAPVVLAPRTDGSSVGPGGVYRLHLGSFMVYNALITYTMPLRLRTGVVFALLFTVAMGLHFVLTDRGLEEHYPNRFGAAGRVALAASLVVGWLTAALVAPTSTLLVALLTALLGGSILLNVFKQEIPSGRRSSFPWFLTGLTIYAGLLTLVTAVSE